VSNRVEVLFIASSPIHPSYPGGFASRQHDFVAAVATRHVAAIRFLAASRQQDYAQFRCDLPVATEVVDVSARSPRFAALGLPRQSVARTTQVSPDAAELVVTFLPNVAHVVLDRGNGVCVLEEGWERGLSAVSAVSGRSRRIERLRYRTLYRRIGKGGLPIVAMTSREARHFSAWIAPRLIHTVPYGVDSGWYSPPQGVTQDIDVLIPGALNRAEQRVEAFVSALRANPVTRDALCVAAGARPRDSLTSMRSEVTEIPGYVTDMRDYIARSKVVVIPTFTDVGIKTTMLQAWAMGRPVITSAAVFGAAAPGLGYESVTAGRSVEHMRAHVATLLRDEDLRREIGAAGRAFVLEHHDRARSETAFADLISSELARIRRDRP